MSDEKRVQKNDIAIDFADIKMESLMNINPKELAKKLDGLERSVELTADYLELEDGEVMRAVYLGQTTFRSNDKNGEPVEVPAVRLYTPGGNKITAGVVIVNSLNSVSKFSPIEITQKGEVKLEGGKRYKDYSVVLLSE